MLNTENVVLVVEILLCDEDFVVPLILKETCVQPDRMHKGLQTTYSRTKL